MVTLLFYIRFRSQLRRTRPHLISRLEDAAAKAAAAAGGLISDDRRLLCASYDEQRIGFWLDMLLLIEKIDEALKEAGRELTGHALVLSNELPSGLPEHETEKLCRMFAAGAELPLYSVFPEQPPARGHTGIWCGAEVADALCAYCLFQEPVQGYRELKEFKPLREIKAEERFPHREKIKQALASAKNNVNTLLQEHTYMGIRDGVYHYCCSLLGDIPPLVIRFNSGPPGPVCFADALTPQLRALLGACFPDEELEELDALWKLLFRERLRDYIPPFMMQEGRRFLNLFLRCYLSLVRKKFPQAPVILEDPLAADKNVKEIFTEVFSSLENRNELLVYGINTGNAQELEEWGIVFGRVAKVSPKIYPIPDSPDIGQCPPDLWETAYTFYLLGAYFPAALFPQLFEEEGLNPQIIEKALELLFIMGIIETTSDPRPCIDQFTVLAKKILGGKLEKINAMVRNRLFAWELSGKISPCFNLLRIVHELGAIPSDALILRSIRGDIFSGTTIGIENAMAGSRLETYMGGEKAEILKWIFGTWKALVWKTQEEVRETFQDAVHPCGQTTVMQGGGRDTAAGEMRAIDPPLNTWPAGVPSIASPQLQAQVKTNLCSYYLGIRDIDAAVETIKELLILNQNLKDGGIPAYRYFSLLNVQRQRLNDALEYSSFALDLAKKTANREEQVKANYFSAVIQFLFGNLSGAERFLLKTEQGALELGWDEWVLRSRFLRGKCYFETGKYGEALELFNSIRGKLRTGEDTVAAWIYRANVYISTASSKYPSQYSAEGMAGSYLSTINASPPVESGRAEFSITDAGLFAVESAFLSGNYKEARDLGEAFLTALGKAEAPSEASGETEPPSGEAALPSGKADAGVDFFFTEQPDWRSGFAQCEYISMPKKTFQRRFISVYHGLAQSCLPLFPDEKAELRNRMQRMIREELLTEADTNGPFYLYAWYRILKETGASQPDINTAITMGFKRLQRRIACIDDEECRKDFVSLNYWNSALRLADEGYKLV